MFILVLLFLIFTGFFAAFRFPNLTSRITSRLRLPRFNYSRAFRNPKIKALLNDRYFFNKHILQIAKGSLFVVLGKNTDKMYDILIKSNDSNVQKHQLEAWSPWGEKGETEAFAILTLGKTHFVFVHPVLFEKNFEENFNSRIRFFIKRLYKVRRQNFIDGILLVTSVFPEQMQQTQKSKPSAEMLDEIAYHALVFQKFSENFKVRLPLFLIEHDFTSQEKIFGNAFHLNADKESTPFGFSCDFLQKPDQQKYEEFLQTSFRDFTSDFELNFQKVMASLPRGIEPIYIMHHVQAQNAALIQGNLRFFLKHFVQKTKIFPASLTILNSILFPGANASQSLYNLFEYVNANGVHRVEIASALLERRRKINISLLTGTICFGLFCSFSIYKSVQFLKLQRNSFNTAMSDFTMLIDSIHSSLENSESDASLALLQETSCRIIKSYADVKKISFHTPFLFPSWKSNISEQLQKKYKDKFSLLFSNFLLQKYSLLVNDMVQTNPLPQNASLKDSFDSLKNYVDFLSTYTIVYNQFSSKKSEQINKALTSISKIIYENKCVENEQAYDFLTTIDSEKLAEFIKLHAEIQKNASSILEERAQQYYNAILNRNVLMNAFLNLNNDMTEFGHLVDSFAKEKEDDENDTSAVKEAIAKTILDYNTLAQEFPPDHIKPLSSSGDFFGAEFVELMESIKKNTIFENKVFSTLNNAAQTTFESFKKKIDVSATHQTKNHFPILLVDMKSGLSLNPDVVNLFEMLKKFNEILPSSSIAERVSSKTTGNLPEDLHKISSRALMNISWVDRKLQVAAQKYTNLQSQYNGLDFDIYPEIFSEYLQDYIFNSLEKYWSNALGASLVLNDSSNLENTEDSPDPHGLVSSSAALKQVVEFLVAEHFENTLTDFDDIFARQIDDVLKKKTILFDRKELFGENANFKSWDGTTCPACDLFHVSSDEALVATLEKQKQILSDFYTQNIEKNLKALLPIVQLRPNLRSFYFNRWYSIQQSLEDKNKSYQNFSNFVLRDLKRIRTDDCPSILEGTRDPSAVWDYFDSRVEYLYGRLNERCRVIYMQTAVENYEELAKSFNELLAGKYPFVRAQANKDAPSADIQDVVRVLSQFQDFNKGKMSFLLKNSPQFEDRIDILNFISQMSKVNSFFAMDSNNLSRDDTVSSRSDVVSSRGDVMSSRGLTTGSTLQIDALFQFRSRKNEEILANRIVDWELKMGEKTFGSLHGNQQNIQFKSKYGDLLTFNLSFSKEVRPKQISVLGKNSSQVVRNNLVTYTLKDNWALFKFIDEHKTCSENNGVCSKEKLKFEIPLDNGNTIVLFCDLNLLNAEGKKIFLPTFPTSAPYLTNNRQTNF